MTADARAVGALTVLWPAFAAAALIEGFVFAFVDPRDLRWLGDAADLDRAAVYTLAFLVFWALTSVAAAVTLWLRTAPPPNLFERP